MKTLICVTALVTVFFSVAEAQTKEQGLSDGSNIHARNVLYTIEQGQFQGKPGRLFFGLRVEPAVINFGTIHFDNRTNLAVYIDVLATLTLNITNVQCSSSHYEVSSLLLASGTNYVIDVVPKNPLPYGIIHERLLVTTDRKGAPELEIPILGTVIGALDARPWELYVPDSNTTTPRQLVVRVRSTNGNVFHILRVLPPADSVHVEQIVQTGDNEYMIRLTVQPDTGLNGKYLRVLTDAQSMPELPIPFRD